MYCSRLFVVVFQEMNVYIPFNTILFIESQSFISPPSLMFVGAAVSEIHVLNRNKKNWLLPI